ncbi:hypothetical protein IMCC3135_10155 [Granulosicoccus antarcticus IMCC3135]|uniref:Tyr recombinase domain-containing protein n=2 Tax=Granulosicoccus TaxID=437504 RepID=A0A2Z2NNL8_9GAMM|nr:hypothetical protein IMCC3135_10155 [Granulosicoccus antarcticus IMCC3135]
MAEIRYTKNARINNLLVERFPLILTSTKSVHWMSLEHFFDLRREGAAFSSIGTYGSHLVDFISQMEVDGIEISEIDDPWLEAYRNEILARGVGKRKQNTNNYASQVLRTVIVFLYWLESNGYIKGVVGDNKKYPVRISVRTRGIKHWLIKNRASGEKVVATPRADWIRAIKPYGPKRSDLSERFELMIDWGASLGLRAMEICSLTIQQLPDEESAERALLLEENLYINIIVSKGGKHWRVPLSPLLVKKTWQYINGVRKIVVKRHLLRAQKNNRNYVDPSYIFISDGLGGGVNPRSLSNSVRGAFRAAVEAKELTEEQRVWLHGLRHNFVTTILRKLDEEGIPRAEAIARQVTRHSSEDAMGPYLQDRYNKKFDGNE